MAPANLATVAFATREPVSYDSRTPYSDALGLAFVLSCASSTVAADLALRQRVIEFVQRLKLIDVPPEQLIVAFKNVLSTFVGPNRMSHVAPSAQADDRCAASYRLAFRWLLDAYYD